MLQHLRSQVSLANVVLLQQKLSRWMRKETLRGSQIHSYLGNAPWSLSSQRSWPCQLQLLCLHATRSRHGTRYDLSQVRRKYHLYLSAPHRGYWYHPN